MENTIRITSREKITTIRVSESTKRELESVGQSGETQEDTLKRLIKFAKNAFKESDTKVTQDNNIIGTKYGKLTRTFDIETDKKKYSVVCTFNDLSPMALAGHRLNSGKYDEWELDLELVNIGISKRGEGNSVSDYTKTLNFRNLSWSSPNILYTNDKEEFLLLYLVAVKEILEGIFGIRIYDIVTAKDYYDIEKWRNTYLTYHLSMESFYRDIQDKIK